MGRACNCGKSDCSICTLYASEDFKKILKKQEAKDRAETLKANKEAGEKDLN